MSEITQFNLRIPQKLKEKIVQEAQQNGRSANIEAQIRLENSFSKSGEFSHAIEELRKLLIAHDKKNRQNIVAKKLNQILTDINARGFEYTIPKLAYDMGYAHSDKVDQWFKGTDTASFTELQQIAPFLGCSQEWLSFDMGNPYSVEKIDIHYGDIIKLLSELVSCTEVNNYRRWFVIHNEGTREIAIVKQFEQWHTQSYYFANTFLGEYQYGDGSCPNLTRFFLILSTLQKMTNWRIDSVILDSQDFHKIKEGSEFPLNMLMKAPPHNWAYDLIHLRDSSQNIADWGAIVNGIKKGLEDKNIKELQDTIEAHLSELQDISSCLNKT